MSDAHGNESPAPDTTSETLSDDNPQHLEASLDELASSLNAEAAAQVRAAATELRARTEALESLTHELEQAREQQLRQTAEFRNYRRRTEEEKKSLLDLGKSMVLKQMLDIYDDFHRSREAIGETDDPEVAFSTLKEGVDLIYNKFTADLDKLGVTPIEAVGQPFSEQEHEAMMQQPAPEGTEPGTVLQEIKRGYRMGDRILRHSQVIVAA